MVRGGRAEAPVPRSDVSFRRRRSFIAIGNDGIVSFYIWFWVELYTYYILFLHKENTIIYVISTNIDEELARASRCVL